MDEESTEQDGRIDEVLKECSGWAIDTKTVDTLLTHLKENLDFPFKVIGLEDDEKYLLYEIEDSGDTMYGLTGNVKLLSDKRRRLVIALCDLEAIDKRSKNFQLLDDYSVWFSNSQ
ncbi:MAG: hypothetical protein HOD85_27100 [Deltaproteobacteria bacterium]|jgi:hypothetical protein|nr:hypothetical protein [Deltaproteobacteria bacterium]